MKKWFWLAAVVPLFLLVGCGSLSEEQAANLIADLKAQRDSGLLSTEQFEALKRVILDKITGSSLEPYIQMGTSVLLGVVGSLTGVRVWRGGVNSRNGAPPAQVTPA